MSVSRQAARAYNHFFGSWSQDEHQGQLILSCLAPEISVRFFINNPPPLSAALLLVKVLYFILPFAHGPK